MIDLGERLGYGISRFLTQSAAHLSCPPGTVVRDLDLDEVQRERTRSWLRDIHAGKVINGTGRGALVTGGSSGDRRVAAGALATNVILSAAQVFSRFPLSGVPFRTLSTTAYVDALKDSYDSDGSDELVRALKGAHEDPAKDVLLLALLELGAEPRVTSSNFAEDQIRALLTLRMERGLPTIVTSKFGSARISKVYGQDMLVDVLDEFVPVKLAGRSA